MRLQACHALENLSNLLLESIDYPQILLKSHILNRRLLIYLLLTLSLCVALPHLAIGQVFDERYDDWPVRLKIDGRLVITLDPQELQLLDELLASPLASESCLLLEADTGSKKTLVGYQQHFKSVDPRPIDELLELEPDSLPQFIAWHIAARKPGSNTDRSATESSADFDRVGAWLAEQLAAGKTIILTGVGAAVAGKFFYEASPSSTSESGLDLLPDCILQLDFSSSQIKQLTRRISSAQRCVGIGLEPQTLLLLDGRKLRTAGAGRAWLVLPRNRESPSRVETLAPRRGARPSTTEWLADLTEWRRDAIDRTLEPFPPRTPQPPRVESGTLVIVGGGGMPRGMMQRFVELAGGTESAKLVYIPCEEREQVPAQSSMMDAWKEFGVQHTALVHTKDRQQANSDEAFLAPLVDATGIWFGGGRQWNLADSYYGTQAHRLMKQVLSRGGVIGGSSAGASIQARYLARATPIENIRIMAPGYERGGLGFLSGVAIDQHFSQRGRQADMTTLVNRYPQLLGIGIDEATALVVQGSQAQVVGQGSVYFYDRRQAVAPDGTDYLKLAAGEAYDLVERSTIHPNRQ